MTVKELMTRVNAERVSDAFLLLDYCFRAENFENTFIEKFQAIPKLKEVIKENIRLFAECTPNNEITPHTIFILSIPSDDYANQWKKKLSAFLINDEEALSIIEKDFHIVDDDGESRISHYAFDDAPIHDMANYTIAKSSLDELGAEICAAKPLAELLFWGALPEQREENIKELHERLNKPIDKNELMKNSISLEELIKKHEEELVAGMSDDEKAYYHAQKRFEEETKEIVQRYRNSIIKENQNQLIKAIKKEYENR